MNIKKGSLIGKSKKTLTVLTATYNRGHLLQKLYQSLVEQSSNDFVWVIMDDGSDDNTQGVVEEFKKRGEIEISYFSKNNGGKHRAINYVIPHIDTDLTIIVDSDDYLTENAVKTIIFYYDKYKEDKSLCGFSFLRQYPDGKLNNRPYPLDEMIGSYISCRVNLNIGGDRAEVFYTDCLREHPFPEFPGEMFINEDVVWIKMALTYNMVHINQAIYVAEYLDGGLTRSGKELKARNPLGGMERGRMMMLPQCNKKVRLKGALFYVVFGKFAKKSRAEIVSQVENKCLIRILYPLGVMIYHIYCLRFRR